MKFKPKSHVKSEPKAEITAIENPVKVSGFSI